VFPIQLGDFTVEVEPVEVIKAPDQTTLKSCQLPQGFNSSQWRCIRDGEIISGVVPANKQNGHYTFTINKCEVINFIVPFESQLPIGISTNVYQAAIYEGIIQHNLVWPASHSFSACPRKGENSLTMFINIYYPTALKAGTKFQFMLTTQDKDKHKLKPINEVYQATFSNIVGPIAELRTDDAYYACTGYYGSSPIDCYNFLTIPALESPLPLYPWPYQERYVYKTLGTVMK